MSNANTYFIKDVLGELNTKIHVVVSFLLQNHLKYRLIAILSLSLWFLITSLAVIESSLLFFKTDIKVYLSESIPLIRKTYFLLFWCHIIVGSLVWMAYQRHIKWLESILESLTVIVMFACSMWISYLCDIKGIAAGIHFAQLIILPLLLLDTNKRKQLYFFITLGITFVSVILALRYVPSSILYTENLFSSQSGIIFYGLINTIHAGVSLLTVLFIYDQFMLYRKKRELMLQVISRTDELTKLLNRREIYNYLHHCILDQQKTNQPLSIIVTDLDFFKQVNDIYGHQIGDRALVMFAQQMRLFTPELALIGRQGGEEFLIVLPHCDLSTAVTIAEDIRKSLAECTMNTDNGPLTISACFGVASFEANQTADSFYKVADDQLYLAKKAGRNRVMAHTP